jgi:hypothetical protein
MCTDHIFVILDHHVNESGGLYSLVLDFTDSNKAKMFVRDLWTQATGDYAYDLDWYANELTDRMREWRVSTGGPRRTRVYIRYHTAYGYPSREDDQRTLHRNVLDFLMKFKYITLLPGMGETDGS